MIKAIYSYIKRITFLEAFNEHFLKTSLKHSLPKLRK